MFQCQPPSAPALLRIHLRSRADAARVKGVHMAKRSKGGKGVLTSQSTRKQRTAKSGRKRKQDSPSDAEFSELLSRPNQIARDIHPVCVEPTEPSADEMQARLASGFSSPKHHCPLAVYKRFGSFGILGPCFIRNRENGSTELCGSHETDWTACEVVTGRRLQPLWFARNAPARRKLGPLGGCASQWVHLSDECEAALRRVTRSELFAIEDERRKLGDDDRKPDALEKNIVLGTIYSRDGIRNVLALYRPEPFMVDGQPEESYFEMGLSAAGHAVVFWAAMQMRLRSMLAMLKETRERLAMPHASRFIMEAKPVLAWSESDIDTLNLVRGEVLAVDREWDARAKAKSADAAGSRQDANAPDETASRQMEENRRAREAEAKHAATAQDDPQFQPANAFPVEVRGRLRMAARKGRRTMKLRSQGTGRERQYSLVDAIRIWPQHFREQKK